MEYYLIMNHLGEQQIFVTAKIVNAVKSISKGKQEILTLGNINSLRDWGHSKDYVYGMWLMLQQEKADDYVLASGVTTSVREFVEKCFAKVDIPIRWENNGLNEIARNIKTNRIIVTIDKKYFRPCEVDLLLGDATKALNTQLGWKFISF